MQLVIGIDLKSGHRVRVNPGQLMANGEVSLLDQSEAPSERFTDGGVSGHARSDWRRVMRIGKNSVGGEQSNDTLDILGLKSREGLLESLNRR